jgi:glycosyltransferase involved in cell wall biosynthesis
MRINYPKVSVIVPIVKNDPHIEECIEAIKASTYKNVEIIVVDEGLERSAQRNIGMRRASGKYYLILDSDQMLTPHVIHNCVTKMRDGYVGIYIPEIITTKGWFGRLRDWERQFYTGTLVDVVRFVKSDCPKFDETLHGVEDSSWERQILGEKSICDFHLNHHDKCGVIKFLKKKAYYAKSLNNYKEKNPNDRLLTLKYRCWDVFTENGKWKELFKRPHYAFGVALLLLARGIIYHANTIRNK